MSRVYIQRLRGIEAEFRVAQDAMSYVSRHWQTQNISQEITRISPRDIIRAEQNVESAHFIRLYAEFEGILKDHLATNHWRVRVPAKPKIDWLLSRVVQVETISVEAALRMNLDNARDFRNSIAHRTHAVGVFITFGTALATLNTFLARLPDPYT